MSITVDDLCKRHINTERLKLIINSQLKLIDKLILAGNNNMLDENVVRYPLPINLGFQVEVDIYHHVYSKIIESLILRKFNVYVIVEECDVILYIKWKRHLSDEDKKRVSKYLTKNIIHNDKLFK